ncbi:MAG: DUF456 domain-containing protein [Flavobacteriales bacterium]|nr:DUF456 domain-containing protein [Flavobacteriales bacterium]MBL6873143.1 DUF456 domain-containing protein [Flavobacteriales bacterium]
MASLIIIICVVLLALGLLGCFVPVIPGPPLAYAALLILSIFTDYKFEDSVLVQWAGIVIAVTVADFWLQVYGVKKFGGTKKAINGTMIGLFVGLFAPIPFGFIIGPFAGAFIGAYLDEKEDMMRVLKIASGALIGFIGGLVLKLVVCGYLIYEFCLIITPYFESLFGIIS